MNYNLPVPAILGCILLLCAAGCGKSHPDSPVPEPAWQKPVETGSGRPGLRLGWQEETEAYSLRIVDGERVYLPFEGAPVRLEVFPKDLSSPKTYSSGYRSAEKQGGDILCTATIQTEAGSVFQVDDRYMVDTGTESVRISRSIEVQKAAPSDAAFNSFFMLQDSTEGHVREYEYLLPALMYRSSDHLPKGAIGSSLSDDWILAREERMGLPFALMYRNGESLALADENPLPVTIRNDFGVDHKVDAAFRFGSLGFYLRSGKPVLTYCYPGSEGERTYADGGAPDRKRWARRSHPVETGIRHDYSLELQFGEEDSFPQALETHWKRTFDLYSPAIADVRNSDIIDAGIELLDGYWTEEGGAPGFPFSVHLPSGLVHETSYAMGFVGMQIPCAGYLYRAGWEQENESMREKGEAILDFWAAQSPNEAGMPRVWWDIAPWNLWRNSNDLRNMQGGMEGMLEAWKQAEIHAPGEKREWLDFCLGAADWLLSKQHEDGSWDKAFDNHGNPIDDGRLLTSNPIRFLSALYEATGEEAYRSAALRAGEYCLREIHSPYRYVGSVIDNPYVLDRESGQKALEAFLSLYELTQEPRWLEAAVQAAYYTATYIYAWNIPPPEGATAMPWDNRKTTVGITIIATGHSGADAGGAYNAYEFFRLYELTRDPYLLEIARILEKNTRQTMDYDGSLGYAFRGLQTEALRLVTPWGENVKLWLPWLTAAALDPLFRLKDRYGQYEINKITIP